MSRARMSAGQLALDLDTVTGIVATVLEPGDRVTIALPGHWTHGMSGCVHWSTDRSYVAVDLDGDDFWFRSTELRKDTP